MRYVLAIALGLSSVSLNLQPVWAAQVSREAVTTMTSSPDKKREGFRTRVKAWAQKALHYLEQTAQTLKRLLQSDQELIRLLIIILVVSLIVSIVVWLLPWPLDVIIMTLALVVALIFLLKYLS